MSKILVEVYIPVIGKSYDMLIPNQLKINESLNLIKKIVAEMSEGLFVPTDETVITSRSDGSILNVNLSVYEHGIKNGSKLMLI